MGENSPEISEWYYCVGYRGGIGGGGGSDLIIRSVLILGTALQHIGVTAVQHIAVQQNLSAGGLLHMRQLKSFKLT